ncbi:MAG: hypothetical protein ACOVSW_10380 [Candidatus Kapaibacteriota bacterium]
MEGDDALSRPLLQEPSERDSLRPSERPSERDSLRPSERPRGEALPERGPDDEREEEGREDEGRGDEGRRPDEDDDERVPDDARAPPPEERTPEAERGADLGRVGRGINACFQ